MKKIKNSKSGISEYKKNLVELLDGINPRTRIINKKLTIVVGSLFCSGEELLCSL